MKTIKYIILAGMAIMALSCARIEEPTQDDLAVGLWETTDVFVNREGFTGDLISRLELERNGAYLMMEGTRSGSSFSESRASTGTWSFSDESNNLVLEDVNGEVINITVSSLTSERMHMSRVINSSIAGEIEIIYRMRKVQGPGAGSGTY